MNFSNLTVGYAFTGSFCTISKSLDALKKLKENGADVIPIMSEIVYGTDTRFYSAFDLKNEVRSICGRDIIHTVKDAEPIGPKKMLDLLIICPCTGNTLAKMTCGITDTAVTMAAKAHLRNERPILISLATNDALGASGKNILSLMNYKNIFFVPFYQDDPKTKTKSLVSDTELLCDSINSALEGKQYQPVVISKQ